MHVAHGVVGHHVAFGALGGFDDAMGVADRGRQRFFHQYVAAVFQGQEGLVGMEVVGAGDNYRVGTSDVEDLGEIRSGRSSGIVLLLLLALVGLRVD